MIHTLISQLALDRAKTILEIGDYWSSPGSARTSAEAVTILRALGGDPPKEEPTKAEKPADEIKKPKLHPITAPVTADESKPADV